MLKHLVMLWRILWWNHLLNVFWGDRWWQIRWGGYEPYTHLVNMGRNHPVSFGHYYAQQWYHTYVIRNRYFSIYLHGSWCHVEIELKFTPKWRTLQFFIKERAWKDSVEACKRIGAPPRRTTWGRFFNTFTNR